MGVIQAAVYVLFFIFLTASFSLIFLLSRGKHTYENQKVNFPKTLFDLLERHGHLNNTLEIIEITQLQQGDLQKIGIHGFYPLAKKVIIKTVNQETKTLECIISSDTKEIIKIFPIELG